MSESGDSGDPTEAVESVDDAAEPSDRESGSRVDLDPGAWRLLRWAAVAGLGLVVLVAGFGLYTSVRAAIDVWVADAYQPLFEALFNLVVLLLAGVGLSRLARGFGGAESGD